MKHYKENDFYQDPIDQWLEENSLLAAVICGFLVYVIIFLVFSL